MQENIHYRNEAEPTEVSTNNRYYVDMEARFEAFRNHEIDMRSLHTMVYDVNNVALAVRQLSKSSGKDALGPDGTSYSTLEPYSIAELSEIVKDRLLNKKMNYVRRTYIPKSNGKARPLGICSIWDKLVEKCIQLVLEPHCETQFVPSSFGFREQVSAHNALAKVKNHAQTTPFALAIDMQDYFGTIDPDMAYREMWHIGIRDKVILNYIFRYIKKGYFENSCKVEDPKGCPQGSILGPLISNIYLHRFDVWLRDQGDCWHDKTNAKFHHKTAKRTYMRQTKLKLGIHVRYADDILVLCKTQEEAERFHHSITKYLTRNMRLVINEQKTKIYDLTRERMKFLGYEFFVFRQNTTNPKKKGKYMVANTLPQKRADEIVAECRRILHEIRKCANAKTIHDWNAYVVGLHNYYRGMTHFYKSFDLIGWRIRKLFYHTLEQKAKFITEQSYKNSFLDGRYKTWGRNGYYCFDGLPIVQIGWANWDSGLIFGKKGIVARRNPYNYGKKTHKPGVSMEDISYLVNSSKHLKNSRYAMFRISKYSSMRGKSYLSGQFVPVEKYHCHHIKPLSKGGDNNFLNLCVLSEEEHRILHSKDPQRLYQMYPNRTGRVKFLIGNL